MKRILFFCVTCALITNVNAQQFYNHLAADSYNQLHQPLKINKKTQSSLEIQSAQRNVIWSENFSNGIQILGLTMGTIPILMEFKYLFLI